jgi:phospholipase C
MENINHVIVVTLENRSFHSILGYMENHATHYNYTKDGQKVFCKEDAHPKSGGDGIYHDICTTLRAIKGVNDEPMTYFVEANQVNDKNTLSFDGTNHVEAPEEIMSYAKRGSIPVIHTLAENFCVCTRWFSSVPSETYPNRDFMVSATSRGRVDNIPHKIWDFFCYAPTIFNRLEEAHRSYGLYYVDTINIDGKDITLGGYIDNLNNLAMWNPKCLSNFHKIEELYKQLDEGKLPTYSYVHLDTYENCIPNLVPYIGNNEAIVADVYNHLRKSDYWEKTLLIITYDECGGIYDSILPPRAIPPDECIGEYKSSTIKTKRHFRFDRYGVRVPTILVSPWIEPGFDDIIYDHTSVLAFLEHRFHLPPLTQRDKIANYEFKFRRSIKKDMLNSIEVNFVPYNYAPAIYNRLFSVVTSFAHTVGKIYRVVFGC